MLRCQREGPEVTDQVSCRLLNARGGLRGAEGAEGESATVVVDPSLSSWIKGFERVDKLRMFGASEDQGSRNFSDMG